MRWEQLDEPVKVRADFQGGVVSPVLFRRGGQRVAVRAVNTRWQDSRGRHRVCFFSVTGDTGDVYQLCFHTGDLTWRLEYVMVDG
jgi:hypothetical protein